MNAPEVTLKWTGESGDGKRAFLEAVENDGWKDLRIEVDTDDCDSEHAKASMQIVMDRCNSHSSLLASHERLKQALEKIAARAGEASCVSLAEAQQEADAALSNAHSVNNGAGR